MAKLPYPTIVVPGVTATYLFDEYPISPEKVWAPLTDEYERVKLHPSNLRFEASEPARVVKGQIFEIAYKELIAELKYNLTPDSQTPVPVYPFGYDWRHRLEETQDKLAEFVDEVIERTMLMRHYYNDPDFKASPKVNLVGHSMGGLVIAGYLRKKGNAARVGKVATIATPFRGSCEAVLKVVTGNGNFDGTPQKSRERDAARLTPTAYYLLPSYPGALATSAPEFNALFEVSSWQPSIAEAIGTNIRDYGVDPDADFGAKAQVLLKRFLDDASGHRAALEAFSLENANLQKKDWLCVVGVGAETRVRIGIEKDENAKPRFVFNDRDDVVNTWQAIDVAKKAETGDGTVPFLGAVPGFLDRENLVCVTRSDFEGLEWFDSLASRTKKIGFHAMLPNMNMLHRLIVAHFSGKTGQYRNIWGRPAPGAGQWDPPIAGLALADA